MEPRVLKRGQPKDRHLGVMNGSTGCIKAKGQRETTHENGKIKTRRNHNNPGHSRGSHQLKRLRRKGRKKGGKPKK